MSKQVKQIRGQVRQIALELIPEILNEELYKQLEKRVMEEISRRLNVIDERQKDMQSYMVRNSAKRD